MLHPTYPITTDRLLLRPYAEGDLDALYETLRLPEVVRFLYWDVKDRDEAAQMLERRKTNYAIRAEGDWLVLAVVLQETGDLLGDVVLKWESAEHRMGEVGFVFHPAYHGKGYASEASRALLRLGFEEMKLHRIVGRCDARNTASARLLERLGMRREAHLVENEWVKGEWTDELIYAMLDREWAATNGS
jgi:RimJ/RimL family protein N-acetyltransferase